jgi:diguanylate cyclase (GGDEF)-like protein
MDSLVRHPFRKKAETPVDHGDEVRARTLCDLFERSRVSILILLVLLMVMRWAMDAAFRMDRRMLILFVFLIVLSLVRLVMALIPSPLRDSLAGERLQVLVFAAGVGLTSLVLGALIVRSWPFLDHVHIAILTAVIAAVVSSAGMSLGFCRGLYLLYMLPMAGTQFMMLITDLHPAWGAEILATLFALQAAIALGISFDQSRTHRQAIELSLKLSDLAVHDTLTRLHNRRFLREYMDVEGARLAREVSCWKTDPDMAVGVFMVDLDRFRDVNDSFGHDAGDDVLRQMAAALIAGIRKSDVLVRWGGEEFVVIARLKHRDHARIVAEKLRRKIETMEFLVPERPPLRKTCSLGYCVLPFFLDSPRLLTWEQALGMADAALYVAKKEGRNRSVGVACGTTSWDESPSAFAKVVRDLKRACAGGYIVLDRGGAAT